MYVTPPWLCFIEGPEGGQAGGKPESPEPPGTPDKSDKPEDDNPPSATPSEDWEAKYKAARDHARDWESRAQSNLKDLETVRQELEDAQKEKSALEHGATVWKVLAESGLNPESAKFLEKLPDEESMRELAAELSGVKSANPTKITRVKDPEPPAESGVELFARARKRLNY